MKKIPFALAIYFFGSIISCCSDEGSITYETIVSADVLLFSFDENGIFPYMDEFNPNELGIAVSADSISSKIVFAKSVSNMDKARSEEHTSELQSRPHLVCRLLL